MKPGLIVGVMVLVLAGTRSAIACGPCGPLPNLRKYISQVDLVVIVSSSERKKVNGEFKKIVRVTRVLKGKYPSKALNLMDISGGSMCPDGVGIWKDESRVLFLLKPGTAGNGW